MAFWENFDGPFTLTISNPQEQALHKFSHNFSNFNIVHDHEFDNERLTAL